jgi:hypothetical protein
VDAVCYHEVPKITVGLAESRSAMLVLEKIKLLIDEVGRWVLGG